jgi:hypothetical protein
MIDQYTYLMKNEQMHNTPFAATAFDWLMAQGHRIEAPLAGHKKRPLKAEKKGARGKVFLS